MKMFIDKFGKEVLIDEDHPLAIAQREKNARVRCKRIDGKSNIVGADGLIHGEPLNLTDDERAALPPLVPLAEGDEGVSGYASGSAVEKPALPKNLEELSKSELAEFAQSRFGLALEKSATNKASMLAAIREAHSTETPA